MRPKGTPEELQRRRYRVIALLEQGERVQDIARFLDLHPKTVYRWKKDFEREGRQALDAKPQPGRTPKLDADQLSQLRELLLEGAKAHGYPDDLWNGQRVRDLITQHFGVEYHVDHVRRLLTTKLRFSSQKPEKRRMSVTSSTSIFGEKISSIYCSITLKNVVLTWSFWTNRDSN